uniref:RING-type domain-containing protein n=1 Tax=Sinocyclocheilus anshuiensis TaxID=1608454 RepID=A0A671LJI0_9TELE
LQNNKDLMTSLSICTICMDLLRDPVTIPCGHNYCLECIKSYWEQKNQKLCSCPECRQTFSPRPALNKNTLFAEVVEKLRQTGMRSPTIPGAENDEVIAKEKQDLVMFCQVCLTSILTLNGMIKLHNN